MSKILKKTLALLLAFSMVAACVGVNTSTAKAAEAMPTGLTDVTFSDWGLDTLTGQTWINNTSGPSTIVGTTFSGYLTFHGTSGWFMLGGAEAWNGLRFNYVGDSIKFDYTTSAWATPVSATLSAETAGVGSTFAETKFLLQITSEVVNTTDVKLGLWFNGVLYNNEYFTLSGAASDLGNRIFIDSFATGSSLDMESYTYIAPEPEVEPEKIPRGLTKLTYSDWGYADQSGKIGLTSNTTKDIKDAIFSGYLTLHGSGQYIHYGATGKAEWDGIRFLYDGTNIKVSSFDAKVMSFGDDTGLGSVLLTPEGAAMDTFAETKMLFQITLQTVGSDLKLGVWFNGTLYQNSYITLVGQADTMGGYLNFVNSGTVDIESYTYVDPEPIPVGLTKLTYSDWGYADQFEKIGLTSNTTKDIKDAIFSGYLTLHDSGQYIHYGATGKAEWDGIRFLYDGTNIKVSSFDAKVMSFGENTGLGSVLLTPEGAGMSTFAETKMLFQITLQTVGSDLKLGVWFNGTLYQNSYITLVGQADTMGGYLNFVNSGTVDIESYTYVDPEPEVEELPTDFKNTTFKDYGWKDGSTGAEGGSASHADATVDKHLFSGKVTFTGTSTIFTYGGKAAWTGIKLFYRGEKIQLNYVNPAGNSETKLKEIMATDAIGASTFADQEFLLQLTTEIVGDDIKLGVWINGVLFENEYVTITGVASELGNIMFAQNAVTIKSYPEIVIEQLPTGLVETTFATYGLKNGIVYDDGKNLAGDITTDLFSGYVTFHGSNIWFSYGGDNNSWAGIRFAFDGTNLKLKDANGEFTEEVTFTSDVAGVELAENRFLLQLTATAVGEDMKLGVWFNGVLYNNEYITLTGAVSKLGKSIGIHQQNGDSAEGFMTIESYGVEAEKPAEKVPTYLKDTTFADYCIAPDANGKVIGQEKAYTTGTVVGNLFSANVELHGDALTFHYGGGDGGTWAGMRMKWDGTQLAMTAGNGEFTENVTFTSEVAGVDLATEMFLLQISMEESGSDVKLGMWFNGKLYNEEYITLTGAAGKFGNKMSVVSWDGDTTNDYMVIESLPVLPKQNITLTPSEFGITDNRALASPIYGEVLDRVSNNKLSLLNKTLSMKVTSTGQNIIHVGAQNVSDWAALRFTVPADHSKISYANGLTDSGSTTFTPDIAGVDFSESFNMQLTFEKVNDNDLKLGVWFEGKLYNSTYIFITDAADLITAGMNLMPQEAASKFSVVAPERELVTSADGYEVKTLNDYGFENGTYTGATVSKEIADLNTDKLVVSGKVELLDGGYLVLVGKDAHYRMAIAADAETDAHNVVIDSTDASFTGIQIPLTDTTATRFGFDLVQTKVDADVDGVADDIELQVWLDGACISSYYLVDYAAQLTDDTYTSVCPGTGSVTILASLDVDSDVSRYYNLADGAYLVLVHTENIATGESYEVGETITIPGDYKVVSTTSGTTITNWVHLWKTGDAHPDGKISSADIVAMKKLQLNMEISKAGTAGAADVDGNRLQAIVDHLLGNATLTAKESDNVSYLQDDNGNAVMPISGFWGPKKIESEADGVETNFIQDKYYQMIADLGINLINYIENDSNTNSDTLAQNLRNLSLAEKYNIGIYVLDKAVNAGMDATALAERLSQYGKYTSFAGLHLVDEPIGSDYNPNEVTTSNTIANAGPLSINVNQYVNLNGYINLFGNRTTEAAFKAYVEEYIDACNPKNTSFDFYPFEHGTYWNTNQWNLLKDEIEKGHARYFSSLKVMRETALAADIPFWSFIQVGDNFTNEADTTTNDTPTKSQFMWNVNTSLAYGAKGIEYFPMIQPYYYANESATSLDYERNGLIGANGEATKWYVFAKEANTWIQTVDEILMDATSTGMLAVGSMMTTQTGYSSSGNGVTVSGGNSNYGALVGVFDYDGKTAYYVVNGNYSTADDTDTTTNAITLTFDKQKAGVIYQEGQAGTTVFNSNTTTLNLPMGAAALIVIEQEDLDGEISATPNLANGAEVALVSSQMAAFANAYSMENIGTAVNYVNKGDEYAPVPVTLEWDGVNGAPSYTVKLATNSALTEAVTYTTTQPSLVIEDLYAATTYYYQVTAHFTGKDVVTEVYTFETADLPRTIYAEGVGNTRDFGGYLTADGTKRVKQGMLYRGAHLNNMTEAGKQKLLNAYGIKTELAVNGGESGAESPLGSTVNYLVYNGPWYAGGDTGIQKLDSTYIPELVKEIQAYADADNYPIYLHCTHGRDRTGTVAALINALLGVSEEDLYLDYELSFFSATGWSGNHADFMQVFVKSNFKTITDFLNGYGSGTLQENTESYLLDIGVTQAEIDSIKNILLEDL